MDLLSEPLVVRCWGHLDPNTEGPNGKPYYSKSYHELHEIEFSWAVDILEALSRDGDFGGGVLCLLNIDTSELDE